MATMKKILKVLFKSFHDFFQVVKKIITWKWFPGAFLGYFGLFALDIALEDGTMRMATLDLLGKTSINLLVLILVLSYAYIGVRLVKNWKNS